MVFKLIKSQVFKLFRLNFLKNGILSREMLRDAKVVSKKVEEKFERK